MNFAARYVIYALIVLIALIFGQIIYLRWKEKRQQEIMNARTREGI
jgi:hypothetical protein